jgi:hypothetical protein
MLRIQPQDLIILNETKIFHFKIEQYLTNILNFYVKLMKFYDDKQNIF